MSVHSIASPPPTRRVRHDVRDGLAVMAFSLACSVSLATLFLAVMLVVGN